MAEYAISVKTICGMQVQVQDLLKPMQSTFNSNITISIGSENEADVKNRFNKMKVGGMVTCDLQQMPWSRCYGAVKDKFGTSWQFFLE